MDFSSELSSYEIYRESFIDFYERALLGEIEALLFTVIVAFLWIMFTLSLYLNFRQRKVIKELISPPEEVLAVMDRDMYTRSRNYALKRNSFNISHSLYSMIQITMVLVCNVMPWLWRFSVRSTASWSSEVNDIEDDLTEQHELKASIVFLSYVLTFAFLDSIPWKFYSNFQIEANYGCSRQSSLCFVLDQLKTFGVALVIIMPVSYCLLSIIKSRGQYFYLDAWGFAFGVMLFLIYIYPQLIAPFLDNFVPLSEGSLKTSIKNLADSVDFPLIKTFVVKSSYRSSHSNAYLYGFWKNKRIVIFDTLLSKDSKHIFKDGDIKEENKNKFTDEEVVAIIAHELGHWKLNHVTQNIIIGQLNLFLMFLAFGNLFNYGTLFKTFGFKEVGTPSLIKLVLIFQFLFSPYNAFLEFMMTLFSRQNEFQADHFVVKLGKGEKLIEALIKLKVSDMNFPIHDKWYSIFNNSHPTLFERINEIYKTGMVKKML